MLVDYLDKFIVVNWLLRNKQKFMFVCYKINMIIKQIKGLNIDFASHYTQHEILEIPC